VIFGVSALAADPLATADVGGQRTSSSALPSGSWEHRPVTWLFTLLSMAVIALVAGVVTGSIAGSMGAPESSLPFRGFSEEEEVAPSDVGRVRFDAALRGYRMEQVDEVLDRLADELGRRDVMIASLQAQLSRYRDMTGRYEDAAGGGYGDLGPDLSDWPTRS
jgi:DivIVA domain-containing protein